MKTNDERKILAENLKNYRKEERISQFEFAEDCGISRDTLSLIERSKDNVTIDTLQLLTARMGKSVSELFSPQEAKYVLVPTKLMTFGLTEDTYGIAVINNDLMIDYIPCISKDYNRVLSIVQLCNEELLSPCHLREVLEDEFN